VTSELPCSAVPHHAGRLPDGDKKFKRAIEPLLEALNRTLGLLVKNFGQTTNPASLVTEINTSPTGSAYCVVNVGFPISELWITALAPLKGQLITVWSQSWLPQGTGAQVLFVGLAPNTTYKLTLRYV
jgi:hypothetical protein